MSFKLKEITTMENTVAKKRGRKPLSTHELTVRVDAYRHLIDSLDDFDVDNGALTDLNQVAAVRRQIRQQLERYEERLTQA